MLSGSAPRLRRSTMRPRTCAMVSPVRVREAAVSACLKGNSTGQPLLRPTDSEEEDDESGSRGVPRRRARGSVFRRPRRRESGLRRRDGRFHHHSPPLPMAFMFAARRRRRRRGERVLSSRGQRQSAAALVDAELEEGRLRILRRLVSLASRLGYQRGLFSSVAFLTIAGLQVGWAFHGKAPVRRPDNWPELFLFLSPLKQLEGQYKTHRIQDVKASIVLHSINV